MLHQVFMGCSRIGLLAMWPDGWLLKKPAKAITRRDYHIDTGRVRKLHSQQQAC